MAAPATLPPSVSHPMSHPASHPASHPVLPPEPAAAPPAANSPCVALEALGFLPADIPRLLRAVRAPLGLVLAVGPRRSGLSTTLLALLAGVPAACPAGAAEPSLPVILDPPPSPAALRRTMAAIPQGRRVFSSLALERAPHVFGHFRALGLSPGLLARDLLLVVAQRRIARLCPACRVPHADADTRQALALASNSWLGGVTAETCIASPAGCPACAGLGHAGHVLVYEALPVDSGVRALAESGATGLEMEQALFAGGQSLWDNGLRLVAAGACSLAALRAAVREPC